MQRDPQYWFPAKRYGWGWGLPSAWQGWAVLIGFFALLLAGVVWFPPARVPGQFIGYVIGLNVLLVAIAWIKGEPPRWRWGGD